MKDEFYYIFTCIVLLIIVLFLSGINLKLKQENEKLRWENWGLHKQIEILEVKNFLLEDEKGDYIITQSDSCFDYTIQDSIAAANN